MMQCMVIDREEAKLQTMAQVQAFLAGTHEIALREPKAEHYWVYRTGIEEVWLCPADALRQGRGVALSRTHNGPVRGNK